MNLPIGIIVIVMAAVTMPSARAAVARPIIDYLGIVFVSLGAAGLTLGLAWGGTQYPWGSSTILGLFILSVISLALFVFIESKAKDPILPLRLFRASVFSVSVVLAFIVGFAMLGALTFLPTYLQYVKGVSATSSGVQTLPLVVGLLSTSILSGIVVGRTGRYKIFPVVGSLIMVVGLFLLSTLTATTSYWLMALDMLVLGVGIGLCMQVLTIIVQNTVDYRDLGVATSGVTFFRTLGSSFGAAIFGTIYANVLGGTLPTAVANAVTNGVDPRKINTPARLHSYSAAQIEPIIAAYSHSIHVVFLSAVPVAGAAFALALFLKETPLRGTSLAGARDVGDAFGMPEGRAAPRSWNQRLPACSAGRARGASVSSRSVRRRPSTSRTAGAWRRSTCAPEWTRTRAWPRSAGASGFRRRCCSRPSPPLATTVICRDLTISSNSPRPAVVRSASWWRTCAPGWPPNSPIGEPTTTNFSRRR